MRLKNGLRKKTIKAIKAIKTIKTILLIMNDKEKIKKTLQEIHDFKRLYVEQLASFSCENSPSLADFRLIFLVVHIESVAK